MVVKPRVMTPSRTAASIGKLASPTGIQMKELGSCSTRGHKPLEKGVANPETGLKQPESRKNGN